MSLLRALERRDYGGGPLAAGPYLSNYGGGPVLPWQIPTNGQSSPIFGGTVVTPETAMRHWAVWACVRIIADVVSTLPLDVFNAPGSPVDPVPTKLTNPSAFATSLQWRYQVMVSLLLQGNAFGIISQQDRLGYPQQIDLVAPDAVSLTVNADGRRQYKIRQVEYPAQQIWHLPGPQFAGELLGMSPIRYAARTIGLGLEAEKFGSDYFQNGINPSGVAESDQTITEEQAATIKDRAKRAAANRDLLVAGAGLSFKAWQVNPEESQFLETQRSNAVAVAQIFGVPPEMIGSATKGDTITYANREQRAQDFLNNAVNPWLARLEEAFTAMFPRGTYVKFNTGALLRSDLQTRFAAYQVGITSGFLLRSEAREFEDWPAVPGIDDQPTPPAPAGPSASPMPVNSPRNT